jgi:hypothetical protein
MSVVVCILLPPYPNKNILGIVDPDFCSVHTIAVQLGRAKWAGTQPGDFGPAQKRPGTTYDGPGQAREKAGPCHGPRRQPDGRHDTARLIMARHSPIWPKRHGPTQ